MSKNRIAFRWAQESCNACYHIGLDCTEEPCYSCTDYSHWENSPKKLILEQEDIIIGNDDQFEVLHSIEYPSFSVAQLTELRELVQELVKFEALEEKN